MKSSHRLVAGALCTATIGLIVSCVTEDVDPSPTGSNGGGGATSAGGSSSGGSAGMQATGTGGRANGAGGGGYTSDPTFATGTVCLPITQPLLTDFSVVAAAPGDVDGGAVTADGGTGAAVSAITFGDFTNRLSGGIYVYPAAPNMYSITSEVNGSWHMTGAIGNYSGFGVYFANCNKVDASAYGGVSFSVQGNVPIGMGNITFSVSTAANNISHLWLNTNAVPLPNPPVVPNFGRCFPTAGQYDGTCASPTIAVPVTATKTTITVRWADLIGGRPEASVTPSEISNIAWSFPAPTGVGTAGVTTYDVDITIDDLTFIPL